MTEMLLLANHTNMNPEINGLDIDMSNLTRKAGFNLTGNDTVDKMYHVNVSETCCTCPVSLLIGSKIINRNGNISNYYAFLLFYLRSIEKICLSLLLIISKIN